MAHTDIWFPFYIGDYLSDTMNLTTAQHGAYVLLLLSYYKIGGPLPDDDGQLEAITKLSHSDWIATRSIVANFFEIGGGTWRHPRADREIALRQRKQLAAREGAAITNSKRWSSQSDSHSESHGGTHCGVHSHSQSQEEEYKKGNEPPLPEVPPMTRIAFDTLVDMRGITKECADWFWNDCEGRGWVDLRGQPIRKVEPILLNFAKNWRANGELRRRRGSAQPGTKKPWDDASPLTMEQIKKMHADKAAKYAPHDPDS